MNSDQFEFQEKVERGRVQHTTDGESIGYSLYEVRARRTLQNPVDEAVNRLECDLSVFIPGHGQKAWTAKDLIRSIAAHSTSGLVWSLDIDPPRGGDPERAEALLAILRHKAANELGATLSGGETGLKLALFGWSHGGGEALRAAAAGAEVFEQVAVFCPTGITERRPAELAWSFSLECLRIFLHTLLKSLRELFLATLLLLDILAGMFDDLLRVRSLKRVYTDFLWACRRVAGPDYAYAGRAALIFGQHDTVIRWSDVFPTLTTPDDVTNNGGVLQRENFPLLKELAVRVIPGNHASPETHPDLFVECALEALRRSGAQPGNGE